MSLLVDQLPSSSGKPVPTTACAGIPACFEPVHRAPVLSRIE